MAHDTRAGSRIRRVLYAGVLTGLGLYAACDLGSCPGPPSAQCTNPQPKPGRLPPPVRSGRYSLGVDASPAFLEKVLQNLTASVFSPEKCMLFDGGGQGNRPPPDASASDQVAANVAGCVGVDLKNLQLTEEIRGGNTVNLITVTLSPWLYATDFKHSHLGGNYIVRLRLTPYLITPQTVPDPDTRAQMMDCANLSSCPLNQIVLDADLDAIMGGANARPDQIIDCHTPGYNWLDEKVTGAIESLTGSTSTRIRIPADPLLSAIGSIVNQASPTQAAQMTACDRAKQASQVRLDGIDLGTDGALTIAVALGGIAGYTAAPFSSHGAGAFPIDYDWGIDIDQRLVLPAVEKAVLSKLPDALKGLSTSISSVSVESFSASTREDVSRMVGHVTADAKATLHLPNCDIGANVQIDAHPDFCFRQVGGKHTASLAATGDGSNLKLSASGGCTVDVLLTALISPVAAIAELIGYGVAKDQLPSILAKAVEKPFVIAGGISHDFSQEFPPIGNLYPVALFLQGGIFLAGHADIMGRAEPVACDYCAPNCGGRCDGGSDGCGGKCSGCGGGQLCDGGQCKDAPRSDCAPCCDKVSCGAPDGCGGTCGCAPGVNCVSGHCAGCQPVCPAGACGMADGCGATCACPAGETCKSGVCDASSCAPGLISCAGLCVNPASDGANCGSCGTVCSDVGAAFVCNAGKCGCPPGTISCCGGDTCVKRKCPVCQ